MKNRKISILMAMVIMFFSGEVALAGGIDVEAKLDIIVSDREAINNTYKLATGKKAPVFKSEFEFLEPAMCVLETSDDYLWAVGGNAQDGYARVLYRSGDLGASWEKVYAFPKLIEGIHVTPKGVILVSISNGRWKKDADCEIYHSVDGGKTFKKVLDLKDGAAISWNFASDEDGYVYISEYGYKEAPNNARKIYRSKDSGISWRVVYNPKPRANHHNHIIQIDKDNKNIIYQSIGDVHKEIIHSTDRGDTWSKLVHDYNPTAMLQIDRDIFWGLDNHPRSGIIKYNKDNKKVDFSLNTPKPYNGSIYDMIYENGVIYAGLLSYSQPSHTWDGSMFISRDKGKTWENFAVWPKLNEKSGVGFYNIVAKDGYGFINGQFPVMRNGQPSHYVGTMKFKLLDK